MPPLPVWTADDEENWQQMMEQSARLSRRAPSSAAQGQNAGTARAEADQTVTAGRQPTLTPMPAIQSKIAARSGGASQLAQSTAKPLETTWQDVKRWHDNVGKRDAEPVPPPPPAPPPPVDQKAWNESVNQYHPGRGNETTATMAGRVYNETAVMKDSPQENEPLSTAQQKMAHSRINAIRKFAPLDVQNRASMMEPRMGGPGYESALEQTRKAVEDDLMGKDPTTGAFFYNMRTPKEAARNGPFQRETVHTVSGPYRSTTIHKYINTYGDPEVKSAQKVKKTTASPKRPLHGPTR